MNPTREILNLYEQGGSQAYYGERVTQLQHALQCAQCAMQTGADEELILAALLHDIGHLLGGNFHAALGVIDHDRTCIDWLRARGFSTRVVALVSGHVAAKRYLVTRTPGYYDRLSETSKETFRLQGGMMTEEEAAQFEQSPYFRDLLRLRSWDEMAKDPNADVPGFESYLGLLERHVTES